RPEVGGVDVDGGRAGAREADARRRDGRPGAEHPVDQRGRGGVRERSERAPVDDVRHGRRRAPADRRAVGRDDERTARAGARGEREEDGCGERAGHRCDSASTVRRSASYVVVAVAAGSPTRATEPSWTRNAPALAPAGDVSPARPSGSRKRTYSVPGTKRGRPTSVPRSRGPPSGVPTCRNVATAPPRPFSRSPTVNV